MPESVVSKHDFDKNISTPTDEPMPEPKNIPVSVMDQDIFMSGTTSDGRRFAFDDLARIVTDTNNAIATSGHKVPLKLGHWRDTQEAKGWVENLHQKAEFIKADFNNVKPEVMQSIMEGRLPFKSIELMPYISRNSEFLDFVVAGVALLGTENPAIPWLNDTKEGVKFSVLCSRAMKPNNGYVINDIKQAQNGYQINIEGHDCLFASIWKPVDIVIWANQNKNKFASVPSGTVKREFTPGDIDETENEFRARVRNPDDFEEGSFVSIDIDKDAGISSITGKLKGEDDTTVQAFRFVKDKWTKERVAEWMNDHGDSFKNKFPLSDYKNLNLEEPKMPENMVSKEVFEAEVAKLNGSLSEKDAAIKDLQTKYDSLYKEYKVIESKEIESLFVKCVTEGKLKPTQKELFNELYAQHKDKLMEFIKEMPVTSKLTGEITDNQTVDQYGWLPEKINKPEFADLVKHFGIENTCKIYMVEKPKTEVANGSTVR